MYMSKNHYPTRKQLEQAHTLSVRATAYVLGIGHSTAQRYAIDGRIPIIRIGNRKLVPAQWVRDQIELTGDDSGLLPDHHDLPPAA